MRRKVLQIPVKLYTLICRTLKADVLTNQHHIKSTAARLASKHIQCVNIICSIFHSNKPEPIVDRIQDANTRHENVNRQTKKGGRKRNRWKKTKEIERRRKG